MAEQEIFLSWSKSASHSAAEAFREFLPQLFPSVKPWMSSLDIEKGTGWFTSISDQLARSRACLLLITHENVNSPWLYYEAGAVALAFKGSRIFPYLLGVKPSELGSTPLGQYQATLFDREDTKRMIHGLNKTLEAPIHETVLSSAFDGVWPKLYRKLLKIDTSLPAPTPTPPTPPPELSVEAKQILAAVSGENGQVMVNRTFEGYHLSAGGKQICHSMDDRVIAGFDDALENLVKRGFLRQNRPNFWQMTGLGYKAAEELTKSSS